MTRTKIIATLGPSSGNETVLRKMFIAGLDVVRLNFSHGTTENHIAMIKMIRDLNCKLKRAIKIMQDLEGYRMRIGKLAKPLLLRKNSILYLNPSTFIGDEKEIPFDYAGSLKNFEKGTEIFIDDGNLVLKVVDHEPSRLKVKVLNNWILKEKKGINIPDLKLEFSSVTEKDMRDLRISVDYKLDYLAQSFVRNAEDIKTIKDMVKPENPNIKIIAKIENKEAIKNIDEIITQADGIMVARGDLGICYPIYKVPVLQKEIIKKCRFQNKPVIVATQMLDSMTENNLPTRAEVSDVANAILDGADFVMLSQETAVGKHPHKVIDMMNKVIKNTENYQDNLKKLLS